MMNRPPYEVADVIREHGKQFVQTYGRLLDLIHLRVLHAIENCRTAALGGHIEECDQCPIASSPITPAREVARQPHGGPSAGALLPLGVHAAATARAAGAAKQTRDVWNPIPGRIGDAARSRGQP